MPEKKLHIISFDVPYPPNYGGVIDVFYKIKALNKAGVKVHLHCFQYGRRESEELEKLCFKVSYYPRRTGVFSAIRSKPYIVESRQSDALIKNLIQDDAPVLFEGLHSCFYIDDKRLKNRKKIYRESNIEHHYYFHLFKAEKNPLKKIYFLSAGFKLKLYEKILQNASMMLVVSKHDTSYLQKRFPDNSVFYLPSFHSNEKLTVEPGTGSYALYNGNLSVAENYKAAEFLIRKVFRNIEQKLIIAGLDPPIRLRKLADSCTNVELIANPTDEKMFDLIKNAHINVLVTFQATGLKLKLLNTLYRGRFCLVNKEMVSGTGLENLCEIASSPEEFKKKIKELFSKNFEENQLELREQVLSENYSNQKNAERLISHIWRE